jgi:RHS repeat-associated protein
LIAPNLGDGYESPQAVTDESGNVIATYVYAGEHPIMRIGAGGQVEYLLVDSMGSVIGKTGSAGAATASIKYTAFGEVASAAGASAGIDSAVGAEPRFHGMTLDAGTGLYFVRARTYDSRTGRFVSRDPANGSLETPERNHPYAIALQCPMQFRDPSGRTATSLAETSAVLAIAALVDASVVASGAFDLLENIRRFAHADAQPVQSEKVVPQQPDRPVPDAFVDLGPPMDDDNQPRKNIYRAVGEREHLVTWLNGFQIDMDPTSGSYSDGKLFATKMSDAIWWGKNLARMDEPPGRRYVWGAAVPMDLFERFEFYPNMDFRPGGAVFVARSLLPELNVRARRWYTGVVVP